MHGRMAELCGVSCFCYIVAMVYYGCLLSAAIQATAAASAASDM